MSSILIRSTNSKKAGLEQPGFFVRITINGTLMIALRPVHIKSIFGLRQSSWANSMRYSSQVKPISYLKANAAEVLTRLAERREPLIITQNGEAKAVLQDVASFEETQETLALLKILALGDQDVAGGKVKPVGDVVSRLRTRNASA